MQIPHGSPGLAPARPALAAAGVSSTGAFGRGRFETEMKGAIERHTVLLFSSAKRGLRCFYLYTCWLARHKNYLINPSPRLASQAGWRLPTQFCTEDDKSLWGNGRVSSSHLIRRRMRPVSPRWVHRLVRRDARRMRAPCGVPLPRVPAGRRQGESRGLPCAVTQLKEWDFLPKPSSKPPNCCEDRLEVPGPCGTAPASGWVTGETSRTHPAVPLLSISHLEPGLGDKPARA